ncbi:MAG: ATP-dependent DNA helicase [Planctomycetes bacterium]|nr:ATP-dependent DNA helicase [Planctomycetota bacterium]
MIRFDPSTRTLSLSVRDLAEEDDYRFAGPSPVSLKRRAQMGQQAHEDHQGAREEEIGSYRRERSVRYETRRDEWRVVVAGRIDGIYTDDEGRTVIEEVKTVVVSDSEFEAITPADYPAYTRQLQLYRYLLEAGSSALAFGEGAPEIALHLHMIALPSKATRTLVLDYTREECDAHVGARLDVLLKLHGVESAQRTRRRAGLDLIAFPHAEKRPHQDALTDAIAAGLAGPKRVLVSAPPGIGKTAASLVPALRRAWELGGRVFVATSKTTQQQIFAETLKKMVERGTPVTSVVLTAREKACLNDVVHCHEDACRYARDYEKKLHESGAFERLRRLPVASKIGIEREAEEHQFCPFEAALDLSDEVDVVIGDYNYAFDPGAALKRMFVEREPDDVVLIVDEAHNLYERARGYYSPELRCEILRRLEQGLVGAEHPVQRRARGLIRKLLDYLGQVGRGEASVIPEPVPAPEPPPENLLLFADPAAGARPPSQRAPRVRPPSDRIPTPLASKTPRGDGPLAEEREVEVDMAFFQALRDELGELSVAWFAEGKAKGGRDPDPVTAASRLVARFTGVAELGGDEFSMIWRAPEGGLLQVLCKDPSRQLARRFQACAGAVAISATLEPLEFYRDVLGLGDDAHIEAFRSPFDPARREVLVLDLARTTYHDRERDLPIVEDGIRAVVAARAGNYLVCCPSFSYLERLHQRFENLPGYEVLRQQRSMPTADRTAVLERLREGPARGDLPVLLFVVQGGIFTEGVDYPGEACVGAIVVGPGLPAVSYERSLMRDYYERTSGKGFEYAFIYPGMNKVIQSAGRVIRTPTDAGVVVLIGARFASPRYSSQLPRDWYRRSPRELISRDPYRDLSEFWQRIGGEGG